MFVTNSKDVFSNASGLDFYKLKKSKYTLTLPREKNVKIVVRRRLVLPRSHSRNRRFKRTNATIQLLLMNLIGLATSNTLPCFSYFLGPRSINQIFQTINPSIAARGKRQATNQQKKIKYICLFYSNCGKDIKSSGKWLVTGHICRLFCAFRLLLPRSG